MGCRRERIRAPAARADEVLAAPRRRARAVRRRPRELAQSSDVELLEAAADGRRDALDLLYRRHAPRLFALAQRMLGGTREAEDLVHDVFLEVWHKAGTYDARRASVSTWLLVRARSRALDRLRSARKTAAVILDEERLQHVAVSTSDAGSERDGHALRALLQALPIDQRTILELGFFAGYSHLEIGQQLSIPIGTVKSRSARALEQLRIRLRLRSQ
jgi:RNA polymerase sigma-70 factor, ECF subfamily